MRALVSAAELPVPPPPGVTRVPARDPWQTAGDVTRALGATHMFTASEACEELDRRREAALDLVRRQAALAAKAAEAARERAAAALRAARPTAVNLAAAVDAQLARAQGHGGPPEALAADLADAARRLHALEVDRCERMGAHAARLITRGARILTHCNAGALATGSAGAGAGSGAAITGACTTGGGDAGAGSAATGAGVEATTVSGVGRLSRTT
ncbi:MAG: hypothetical protein ACLGHP_12345, partial [Vicinamibacteria bacterium]